MSKNYKDDINKVFVHKNSDCIMQLQAIFHHFVKFMNKVNEKFGITFINNQDIPAPC